MKKLLVLVCCSLLLFGYAGSILAADNDGHDVEVIVNDINEVALSANTQLTLEITDDTLYDDDSTYTLSWATNGSGKKIVVTSNADYTYDLTVTATGISGGTAEPTATIAMAGDDVASAISTTTGSCTLHYELTALITQSSGTETHTVTYTMTDS